MAGQIHRQKKNRDFVTIDTHCLRNPNLKWDAKGLHSYLMQLPDDWSVNIYDLQRRSKTGRDGTQSAMDALIKEGYVYRELKHGEGGKFDGYDYHLFERPEHTENWKTVNGKSVNGLAVNGKSVTNKYDSPTDLIKDEERGEKEKTSPPPAENFSLEAENKKGEGKLPAPPAPIFRVIDPDAPDFPIYDHTTAKNYPTQEPEGEWKRVDIAEETARMQADQTVLEGFVIGRKLPREKFSEYLEAFRVEQVGLGTKYANARQLRLHFQNWSGSRFEIAQRKAKQASQQQPTTGQPAKLRQL